MSYEHHRAEALAALEAMPFNTEAAVAVYNTTAAQVHSRLAIAAALEARGTSFYTPGGRTYRPIADAQTTGERI